MGSLAPNAYPGLALDTKDAQWPTKVAFIVGNILQGKLNNTGNATLTAGAASTTVSDVRCGPNSVVLLMQAGAVELGHWSVQTRTSGAFTVTRASTTGTCSIAYAIFG